LNGFADFLEVYSFSNKRIRSVANPWSTRPHLNGFADFLEVYSFSNKRIRSVANPWSTRPHLNGFAFSRIP